MTHTLDPPRAAALMPIGRFDWERLVRRIVMPTGHKLIALILATWADPNGSRVRPGLGLLAASTGVSERTARRVLGSLARDWGLIDLVARGGGRNGKGKTAEYRLTIPTDLLERLTLLGPDGLPDSPANYVASHSAVSPDIQVASDYDGGTESLATQVADQTNPAAPIDRPNGAAFEGMTGQIDGMTGHPAWPTTNHITNHQTRPTPRSPTNSTTDRAREPPNDQSSRRSSRCLHGLKAERDPDGNPRCPFCRREPQEPP